MTGLVEQENFTNLTFVGDDLIFAAESVGRHKVIVCSHFLRTYCRPVLIASVLKVVNCKFIARLRFF